MEVILKVLPNFTFNLPSYATDGAACADIYAARTVRIDGYEHAFVPTGFAVEIPPGWEIAIRPRSGLANKKLLIIPNSPGTIDSDYRGEILVGLFNLDSERQTVEAGERIAQMALQKIERIEWKIKNELSTTARGTGGFGSTGA